MHIDWNGLSVRINLTGRSAWVRGRRLGWCETIPDHDIWFVFEGNGALRGKAPAPIPLVMGSCLWLTPGTLFEGTQDPDNPIRNYYVHFDLFDADGRLRPYDLPHPPEALELRDTAMTFAIMRHITALIPFFSRAEAHRFPPESIRTAEALMRGLLMELDQGSYRGAPDVLNGTLRYRHDLVMRIIALIQDEPDRFRTVSDLADEAGYSLEHFSRVFRSVMSRSPDDFLIQGRIDRAKRLLADSSMSIQEIAQTLGYQRQSFFSTQFRQKTGQTPREFRTQYHARRAGP